VTAGSVAPGVNAGSGSPAAEDAGDAGGALGAGVTSAGALGAGALGAGALGAGVALPAGARDVEVVSATVAVVGVTAWGAWAVELQAPAANPTASSAAAARRDTPTPAGYEQVAGRPRPLTGTPPGQLTARQIGPAASPPADRLAARGNFGSAKRVPAYVGRPRGGRP